MIEPEQVEGLLKDDLESILEQRTDYGRGERPDWDAIVRELEEAHDGLDLGDSMTSPTVRAIVKLGRRLYAEMKEA